MPIYEYVCGDCQAPFEKLVFKSGQPVECPSCGSPKAQQQVSVFRAGKGSNESTFPTGGGCGCTPSGCGCR